MRPRLTNEEREARRKERARHSFSDAAYEHYDTVGGWGNAEEWIRTAEAAAAAFGTAKLFDRDKQLTADLGILCLVDLPDHVTGLKKAFRNVMMMAHPDHGGTNEEARAVMEAYNRLLKRYETV